MWSKQPVVYEINTVVWLNELSRSAGKTITLADVPKAELDRLKHLGFDALWLMGVWERSPEGRRVAQDTPAYQPGHREALPDCTAEDVLASPYAVHRYRVDPALGGDAALAALRLRLRAANLPIILDFVPNHTALDHPWVSSHPMRFVEGSRADLARDPANYFQRGEARVLAHGRDPYFPGWLDTVQLDYRRRETQEAMAGELLSIAERCDGVRCDMAMLVNEDVFLRTWGGAFEGSQPEFWLNTIPPLRKKHPDFLLLAEVYWGREEEEKLLRFGFDFAYDKQLYDHLLHGNAEAVRFHLRSADVEHQNHVARFIENHDEPRAMTAFGLERGRAAAVLALTLPGLRLLHEGQMEGRRLHVPVRLARRHPEPPEPELAEFYRRLLATLRQPVFHDGGWRLIEPRTAGQGNSSHQNYVAFRWRLNDDYRLLAVNFSPHQAQCFLPLDAPFLAGRIWELRDLLGSCHYVRDGNQLLTRGLFLDIPGWAFHAFEFRPAD